jgi:hypothetical protein
MLTTALIILAFVIGLPFGVWMMWMSLEADQSHRNDMWKD